MDLVAIIPVGYPAVTPTRDRKPVSEVCKIIGWNIQDERFLARIGISALR